MPKKNDLEKFLKRLALMEECNGSDKLSREIKEIRSLYKKSKVNAKDAAENIFSMYFDYMVDFDRREQ